MRHHHHHHGQGDDHGRRQGHWSFGPFEVKWDIEREMGGGRGRGGRRGRMFDGSELRLVLLKLIADEPRHGYDLIREIETMTGGAYAPSPGVIYPTITLLDEMGFIEEQRSEGAKKRFAATDAGRTHLAENAELVETLVARLRALAEHRERTDSAPIRRAMIGLKIALGEKFGRGDASKETAHDVAAMIDELAQKVERLK
ncbi:PadR family transcriptional regulator [uncultured Sphingomonas sp.]|uniref:PadR family transcriptional regulator n=1 Tax=uncultured Sphingomonas sp. TaxID=158754 RepID=UPI0025FEB253|nr:PadR family transcriptional regulator [uncultured Sphingomonas sp.]